MELKYKSGMERYRAKLEYAVAVLNDLEDAPGFKDLDEVIEVHEEIMRLLLGRIEELERDLWDSLMALEERRAGAGGEGKA